MKSATKKQRKATWLRESTNDGTRTPAAKRAALLRKRQLQATRAAK